MQPFRTILFAADFSENSKEAFRAACVLAVENQTRLIVLHVVEPDWVPEDPVYFGQPIVQYFATRDERRHEALKRKLGEVFTSSHPMDVQYHTKEGDAPAEILRMADEIGSDLIVMGTHGSTGLRRLLAGSVAMAVLRGAHCPILALRPHVRPLKAEEIRVILHPTDFSDGSEAALRVARLLARERGARLILLHVAPSEAFMKGAMPAELDAGYSRDALESARERTDGSDLKYPVETWFSRGMAPEEIVRVAEEVGCDLIVMGTHGRTGLGRLLMGNTAESVLPEANCPVMIVKASRPVSAPTSDRPAQKMVTIF